MAWDIFCSLSTIEDRTLLFKSKCSCSISGFITTRNIRTPKNILYREFGVRKLKDLCHFTIRCIVHKLIHSPHLLPVAINEIF